MQVLDRDRVFPGVTLTKTHRNGQRIAQLRVGSVEDRRAVGRAVEALAEPDTYVFRNVDVPVPYPGQGFYIHQ